MRKLKLQMHISLDGFVAGPNGEEDWIIRGADPTSFELVNELADTSDTLLIGRKMAENFIPHFEEMGTDHPIYTFAQKMVNLRKILFSKTLKEPFGKNLSLASDDLSTTVTNLKNQAGKDILVYGGAQLVSSLIAGDHIDEFYLFINPILINKGMRIFDILNHRQKLQLLDTKVYIGGTTLLHYRLDK